MISLQLYIPEDDIGDTAYFVLNYAATRGAAELTKMYVIRDEALGLPD